MPSIKEIEGKSILSPDSGYMADYDYTLTPFLGCGFGCSFCYVPTLYFSRIRGLSEIWGDEPMVKENAPELLLAAAKKGKLAGKRIYLSPNTDPYQPVERKGREDRLREWMTRRLLEIFCEYPPALLVIQTRAPWVTNDLDLLRRLGEHVVVAMSITTDREDVRKIFERKCAPIQERVNALAALHEAGIRTQASLAPLLPCNPDALAELVDAHCEWIVVQALKRGA